jgi:hypothetical protein
MQHEAISNTLKHIREQCDISREMQVHEARLAYKQLLNLEEILQKETKRDSRGSNKLEDYLSCPGQRSPEPSDFKMCVCGQQNSGIIPVLSEFELYVLEYMEANRSLTNQRIR